MNKKFTRVLLLIVLLNAISLTAQNHCVDIKVIDAKTLYPIPNVHVISPDFEGGSVSDKNGLFSLCNLSKDSIAIEIMHTAYNSKRIYLNTKSKKTVIIKLTTHSYETDEVTVVDQQSSIIHSEVPGKITFKKKDIMAVPKILGSSDVIKAIQLTPGIQAVNEANSGIYVRGGSPGQNYIVFDDMDLINPTHIMGIYSVFNPLMVDNVQFYKGNAPMHLSSRIASSIIIKTSDQKTEGTNWEGNIGNIATNLTYKGQSKDNKWFFSSGFRRSYLELFKALSEAIIPPEENYFKNNDYRFFDFNGKLRYQDDKNRLKLSWYKGEDYFKFFNPLHEIFTDTKWGNDGISLIWQHIFSSTFTIKNSLQYSGYFSNFNADLSSEFIRISSDYKHLRLNNELLKQFNNHHLRLGLTTTRFQISPQEITISLISTDNNSSGVFNSISGKLYLNDQWNLSENWNVLGGLSLEKYLLLDYNNNQESINSNSNSNINLMWNGMVSVNYLPSPNKSYKASYSYISQNLHYATVASIPLPIDIWIPPTNSLHPEAGHQLTLGYYRKINKWQTDAGIEGYGKFSSNNILLDVNINNEDIENFDDHFFLGDGLSYGLEFFAKRNVNRLQSQFSYTLGWAKQRFNSINNGEWHDAKYDRRHDLSLLTTYKINERWDMGGVFIFATGNKATLPTGRYWLMGDIANDYEGVNNFRMPPYHRLDLSFNYHLKSNLFKESIINFSIINVLNRGNPYFIYYIVKEGEQDYELNIQAKQVSLFPFMPSISWNVKF